MKFTILQQDLMPTLQAVARSTGVRSQLPVLGNILLQAESGKLKLSATNLEIGVVKFINAEILEEGEVTVPAKTFVEVITNLSGEKLSISAGTDQIEISTPTFSSKLNGISATEFPSIPLLGKDTVSIESEILVKSLPEIIFAAAMDDGRPTLTGILTEIKDKKLQLVATDGYRLAHKIVPIAETAFFKALVPKRTFEEIVRLISEDSADLVKIAVSEDNNQMIFSFGNTQVSSRLIEGQFPAWEKIIPEKVITKVILERSGFLKAVKLAAVFSRNEANIVKLNCLEGKIILSSEAKELGSQEKQVEAEKTGEEINIAFNTKFLIDAFSNLNTTKVAMEFSGILSATLIKPIGEEGLQYIVMPVNLS
ncbi:MAG: DNA polymerase III subunit beta [Candidatus Daviesbacteria bacterium]|nr:DNA polymerase III subunit beta [Candidatus Daviesbacteria bacterium]